MPRSYYSTLKFRYKFPKGEDVNFDYSHQGQEEGVFEDFLGTVICFAYGLPYTYSDLLSDFENAKKFLINNGGNFIVQKNTQVTSAVKITTQGDEEETKEIKEVNSKFASPRTSQFTGINDSKPNTGTF
jgi:hypothetical protein